jgi:hypothetical protein
MLEPVMLPTRNAGKGDDVRAPVEAVKNGGLVSSTSGRTADRESHTATISFCATAGAAEQAGRRCADSQPHTLRGTGPEDNDPCNVPPACRCWYSSRCRRSFRVLRHS